MNAVLFELLKAVVIISIMLIVGYGIPYLKATIEKTKYAQIVDWVGKAVLMAEQTVLGTKAGAEKKAIVIDFIKRMLVQKNIAITDEQLNILIESAVFAMKNGVLK